MCYCDLRYRSPQPNDEKIQRLYRQGVETRDIAYRLGISQRAVQDAINAARFIPSGKDRAAKSA